MGNDTNPFEYQQPNALMVSRIEHIRSKCRDLHDALLALTPCRERSIAITKLEEVSMWANKSIVFDETLR